MNTVTYWYSDGSFAFRRDFVTKYANHPTKGRPIRLVYTGSPTEDDLQAFRNVVGPAGEVVKGE